MLAFLAVQAEPVPLEDPNQVPPMHRPYRTHGSGEAHGELADCHEFGRAPFLAFALVTGFLENLVQSAHAGACGKEAAHRVADVLTRLFVGSAAARFVQGRHRVRLLPYPENDPDPADRLALP